MNRAGKRFLLRLLVLATSCVLISVATETLATAEALGDADGTAATAGQPSTKPVPVP